MRPMLWSLIGDTLRLGGRFGGSTAVDNIRRQVEDLAGALGMGTYGNDLSRVPKQTAVSPCTTSVAGASPR
jgi:hypothetical protein